MDLNYKNINLFPTIIHQFDVNGFGIIQKELIDYSYDLKKKDPIGSKLSNAGGWQSNSFAIDNNGDLLHKFLINCIGGFPSIHESISIHMTAWININKKGDYNIKHNHPSSDLSGVLWIKCPKKCGDIIFDNPSNFQDSDTLESYTQEFKNRTNFYNTYFFTPTEGRILVFPAHLNHRVSPNESHEDRISVSFNIRLSDEN